jgi:hypothetical protein
MGLNKPGALQILELSPHVRAIEPQCQREIPNRNRAVTYG